MALFLRSPGGSAARRKIGATGQWVIKPGDYQTGNRIRGRAVSAANFEHGRGVFDSANAEAVQAGREMGGKKVGAAIFKRGCGIFDPANAKAVQAGNAKSGETRIKCSCGDCKSCKSQIGVQKHRA